MDWVKRSLSTERELRVEMAARSMEPREAQMFKTLVAYQEMLQAAVHEVMRLEFELEDLRQQVL